MSSPASSTALDQASPWLAAASSGVKSSVGDGGAGVVRVNCAKRSLRRSQTPRKSPAMPTGQVSGVGCRPVRS